MKRQRRAPTSYSVAVIDCFGCSLTHVLAFASGLRSEQGSLHIVLVDGLWSSPIELDAIALADCHYPDPENPAVNLRACLRAAARPQLRMPAAGTLSCGALRVDLIGGFARLGKDLIELQPLQLRVLAFLMIRAGRSVSCEELRRFVFRVSQRRDSTSLARQISTLRKKLGPTSVQTVVGGYALGPIPGDDSSPAGDNTAVVGSHCVGCGSLRVSSLALPPSAIPIVSEPLTLASKPVLGGCR